MKRLCILGSTGALGRATENVVAAYPDRFNIVALAAGENVDVLFEQIVRWRPPIVSVASEVAAEQLRKRLRDAAMTNVEIGVGSEGMVRAATQPSADFVVCASVGVAGLEAA